MRAGTRSARVQRAVLLDPPQLNATVRQHTYSLCHLRYLFLTAIWGLPLHVSGAQGPVGCAAYEQPTQWPAPLGSGSGAEYVPTDAQLERLLGGAYTIHLVTTEGTESPRVSSWRIVLLRPDSLAATRGGPSKRVMVGTRTDLPRPTPLDSLRRGRLLGEADIEMSIDSAGDLSWQTAPGVLDRGLFFQVSSVDSTGFSGRWIDGSIAVLVLRRGPLSVAEKVRGYYCAIKER
jgi:hypothetical protein